MYTVLEADKSFVDAMSYQLRTGSNTQQIKFSPTCPASVSKAVVYFRPNDTITAMEINGHNFVVVVSYDAQPDKVLKDIKGLAGLSAQFCQLVTGVQANELAHTASKIT